jgi:putative NADH-flavin reductase
MKVALFGASGNIGTAIAHELVDRGHEVTGITRSGTGPDHNQLILTAGDVTDPAQVADLVAGHDAVASAVGPKIGVEDDTATLVGAANSLIQALPKAGVKRLVVLGGAGSLETSPGVRLIDHPEFPSMWKANALAQADVLNLLRTVDNLDWTFISPAGHISPGPRTATYRVGGDQLLVDDDGNSEISIADYAIAFVDELEQGKAIKRRIGVAY